MCAVAKASRLLFGLVLAGIWSMSCPLTTCFAQPQPAVAPERDNLSRCRQLLTIWKNLESSIEQRKQRIQAGVAADRGHNPATDRGTSPSRCPWPPLAR